MAISGSRPRSTGLHRSTFHLGPRSESNARGKSINPKSDPSASTRPANTAACWRPGVQAALLALLCSAVPAAADAPPPADQSFAIHGQFTVVAQGVGGFASPYAGNNSLLPHQIKATTDATAYLGLFLRAGASNGAIETYGFTDIDRTLAFGVALKGAGWGRPRRHAGLSGGRQRHFGGTPALWLAAGGLGVQVGDGALPNPRDERIVEAWDALCPTGLAAITLDYQHIATPGYNRDRGPVNVFGMRLHAGF